MLQEVNNFHPNLEFTLETLNDKRDLAFLDITVHVNEQRMITCKRYQEPTDTGIILNFRSCTPLQHKKDIIRGTMHRLVRCTCNWKKFHEALKVKEKLAKKIISRVFVFKGSKRNAKKFLHYRTKLTRLFAQKTSNDSIKKKKNELPSLCLQQSGNLSLRLQEKLNTAAKINVILTTRELKTCLPTLKLGFEKHLMSHLAYQITC